MLIERFPIACAVAGLLALAACDRSPPPGAGPTSVDAQQRISRSIPPELRDTIGEYAFLTDALDIKVEGYGLVVELPGTGSGDMDPKIRDLLVAQLYRAGAGSALAGTQDIIPERIMSSNQVAAVEVRGRIPPLARRGSTFDLVVNALPNSQATSLANGLLWSSELKVIGLTTEAVDTATIATGRGPVYVPSLAQAAAGEPPDPRKTARVGRILGGGVCSDDRPIRLQLNSPSFRLTQAIERVINARFPGRDKFADVDPDAGNLRVRLRVPPDFESRPQDFIDLVRHMYLTQDVPGVAERKAAELISALRNPAAPRRDLSTALQALGRAILPDYIQPQYTSPDPAMRFWCARAGAEMLDVGAMVVLQEMATDRANPYHTQALTEMIAASRGHDTIRTTLTLAALLDSTDPADRIAAYEGLLALHSSSIWSFRVGRKFYLDVAPSDGPPLIYVSQADLPRIALIGKPIILPPGALYISPDKALSVGVDEDAPPAKALLNRQVVTAASMGAGSSAATQPKAPETVSMYWRSPFGDRIVNVRTVQNLPELIMRLTWIPDPGSRGDIYIGASYQRVVEMLGTLSREHLIDASMTFQKAPEILVTPAELLSGARPEGLMQTPATTPATTPAGTLPAEIR